MNAAIASLDAVTNADGVLLDASNSSLLGASCRLKPEESAMVEILMSQDKPLELEPNPYDPYLINQAEVQQAASEDHTAANAADANAAKRPGTASSHEASASQGNDTADVSGDGVIHTGSLEDSAHRSSHVSSDMQLTDTERGRLHFGGAADSAAGASVRSLAEIDAQLMDLALDHDWDDSCSLADFGTHGSASVRSLRTSVSAATRTFLPSMAASTTGANGSGSGNSASAGASNSGADASAPASMQGRSTSSSVFSNISSAARKIQRLPSIPERIAVASTSTPQSEADSQSTSLQSKKFSKHDQTDYLRPMREQRELDKLCASPLCKCSHGFDRLVRAI